MRAYYDSEKSTTFTMMGLGGLSIAAGAVLATRGEDLSRGLGWSMVGLGVLEGFGGLTYLFTVNREIVAWAKALDADPGAFKRDEAAHIEGTTKRFVFYRAAELTLFAGGVGVAAYGLAAGRDVWLGIGLGVALETGLLFIVDTLGNSRAEEYEKQLQRFDVGIALSPEGPTRSWSVALAGRF
jgi:hypothetical protein